MMELLAPAGTMENFMAALEAGADAIYLGGKVFNARSHAGNFDYDELREALRLAHILQVGIYVTVNILVGDRESKALAEHLRELEHIGVDGIIVQDLGVARISRQVAPTLELHGSTQMTAANLETVQFLERLGFTRVVLSRELSLDEIRHICAHAKAEIEVFIHGALCISYSGQCLMSSFIGGRSGNRGSCAQPCRLPYQLVSLDGEQITHDKETYIMSPKDLNYSAYMKELIEAGVASFKVEGRMKKVSYVHEVIGTYRTIIDRSGQATEADFARLEEGFNRGFSTAYLENNGSKSMMTISAPNHLGKYLGKGHVKGRTLTIETTEIINVGDLLKVISHTGDVHYITVSADMISQRGVYKIPLTENMESGKVYRASQGGYTKQRGLKDFTRKYKSYMFLHGEEGSTVSLTMMLESGQTVTVTDEYILQMANNKPTSTEKITEQLGRLGNTLFDLDHVTVPDGLFMWPSSVLNNLRRSAVEAMEELLIGQYVESWETRKKNLPHGMELLGDMTKSVGQVLGFTQISTLESDTKYLEILVDSVESVLQAVKTPVDRIVFGDPLHRIPVAQAAYEEIVQLCRDAKKEIIFSTPRVIKDNESTAFRDMLSYMVQAKPDGIRVHFLGALEVLHQLGYKGIVEGDTGLQTFNSHTLSILKDLGFTTTNVSLEATLHQMNTMASKNIMPIGAIVQGRVELMISEYCPISSFAGTGYKRGCPLVCTKRDYALQDRKGEVFPIYTDPFCRTHIMNSRELDMKSYIDDLRRSGLQRLIIDGRQRSPQWIVNEVSMYHQLLEGSMKAPSKEGATHITRGHFFKGILGES